MAATSYTTLPSNAYVGLGSQGELFHSANYGSYDAAIGSITSHPYQYQTTNYGSYLPDNQQPSSYSNDFLRSTQIQAAYSKQEPQYYPTDKYASQPSTYNQNPPLNDYNNSQTQRYNNDGNYAPATHKPPIDNHHHVDSNHQHQTSHTDTTQHHYSVSAGNPQLPSQTPRDSSNHPSVSKQRHQSQPNIDQTEGLNSKQPLSVQRRSPVNSLHDPVSAKPTNPPPETKQTKSTRMRAAAIKKKEETREKKEKDGNFPSIKKKLTPPPPPPPPPPPKSKSKPRSPSDDEQLEKNKSKRNNTQSKPRKSRRDGYQTDDNNTTAEEDNHDERPRNKSKKRTAFSDSHRDKLPPVRRGQGPPFYDPYYDYPYPPVPPPPPHFRGRHPYYDDYPPYGPYPHPGRYDHRHHHLYEDGYDAPPYVDGHHAPYDGFFDYEKRKGQSKSKKHKDKKEPIEDHEDRDAVVTGNETEGDEVTKSSHSKKSKNPKNNDEDENEGNARQRWYHPDYDAPHYDDRYALEVWRKERNDYLKKTFKPTVHDILYSQQFLKSDSYVENQRRRALRDAQGYYFPYKKYTLKDYKDLQKQEANHNPYAAVVNEVPIDRKERAKKRQEYGTQIERQNVDISGGQQKTPRDMPPKKPWHVSNGELNDPSKLSKRERAIEYAKVQVTKNRPGKAPKNRPHQPDPTEQYVNSLFPQADDDDDNEDSADGRDDQSNNDDD